MFTTGIEEEAEHLDRALRQVDLALTEDKLTVLVYRYVAAHELGHVFEKAVRRASRRNLGRSTLKAGLAERLRSRRELIALYLRAWQRRERLSAVGLQRERFAEGVALAHLVHILVEQYPQLAGREHELWQILTEKMTHGAGYNRPHPPLDLARILRLAADLETTTTARRRWAARVLTVIGLALALIVGPGSGWSSTRWRWRWPGLGDQLPGSWAFPLARRTHHHHVRRTRWRRPQATHRPETAGPPLHAGHHPTRRGGPPSPQPNRRGVAAGTADA